MTLEWQAVPRPYMNGVPLGYNVNVYESQGNPVQTISVGFHLTSINVINLLPSMKHTFEVCAYNKIGQGPCERFESYTLDSGKYYSTIT